MRKWEDIVKDKVEEPEGELPESIFAEFRARREAAAAAPAPKRFPLMWAAVPAVAAGLAAVLLLHKPSLTEGEIQIINQPSAPVAIAADSTTEDEPEQAAPLIALAVTPKAVWPSSVKPQEVDIVDNVEPAEGDTPANIEDKATQADVPQRDVPDSVEEETPNSSIATSASPFIPESAKAAPIKMKVGPAAGIIAGGGLLAAAISPISGTGTKMPDASLPYSDNPGGTVVSSQDPTKDERTGDAILYFPLKLGLSARFPISKRISFTTGLDYSWYKSLFTYSLSGEKVQNAHYLGIPVRLDWTLASNKWLDVYLGGGLEADYCLGATLAGEWIVKDGFGLSLLGAGGIQLNLTNQIGLYVEPGISWTIPSESYVLQTYRSDNPVMFSLTSGIRIIIGK